VKRTIDWSEIHRRVDDTHKLIEQGFNPTHEEKKRILAERARILAHFVEDRNDVENAEQIVEFLLADEHYGFEMKYIREILPFKKLTPVPCTPDFILGITSIRGQILSVMDMKKFFNLPQKGLTDLNKLIILHDGDMELGILADRVFGEKSIQADAVQTDLPTLSGIGVDFLKGVTADGLILLDASWILADKKILVEENV
jgi:purine-binding chemotaxis protein CheW